jgi:hypothetical protein
MLFATTTCQHYSGFVGTIVLGISMSFGTRARWVMKMLQRGRLKTVALLLKE